MSIALQEKLQQIREKRLIGMLEKDPMLAKYRQLFQILANEAMDNKMEELADMIVTRVTEFGKTVKNGQDGESITGPKGEQGNTPTADEIITLIKPLIPQPVKGDKGDMPKAENILALIKPLIPKVKDGKTPTDEELLNLIRPLIPAPLNGKDGRDGVDGSPDKPKIIAEKLNTLKDVVENDVIKGLTNLINNLRQSIRENKKGGGMGNAIHETFLGDGLTTSFLLSSNVAASGNAIWIRYQGQTLVHTEHYTISGKSLSLVGITPATGTSIDVTYIRT